MEDNSHETSKRIYEWAKAANITSNVVRDMPESMFSAYERSKLAGLAAGLYRAAKEVERFEDSLKHKPEPGDKT